MIGLLHTRRHHNDTHLDGQAHSELLAARHTLFDAADHVSAARDRHDDNDLDRWERETSRARVALCKLLGAERLVERWSAWHHDRWPSDDLGDQRAWTVRRASRPGPPDPPRTTPGPPTAKEEP